MPGISTVAAISTLTGGLILLVTYACHTLLRMQEKVVYPILRVRALDGSVQPVIRLKNPRINSFTQRRTVW